MLPEFQLLPEESALIQNSLWLVTKQRIIGKVYGLFGELSDSYNTILSGYSSAIPQEVTSVSPKIYRGEQYRQLPYVMMDHPRYFKQEDVFAIRSFFWWGNSFSIHLMLGGKYKLLFEPFIRKHIGYGGLENWFLGVSADPCQHHFERDNYMPVNELKATHPEHASENYLKIGKWHPLNEWKTAPAFFTISFKQLLEGLL
jgi:hypothetical protein